MFSWGVSLVCREYSIPQHDLLLTFFLFLLTHLAQSPFGDIPALLALSLSSYKMQFQQRVLLVLVFLSMLVCGNKEKATRARARAVGVHNQLKYPSQVKQQEVEEKKRLRRHHHSFEAFFASKRKVPNASDPLHNR